MKVNSYPQIVVCSNDISGGYSDGVPPLPIPNREVKPDRADGTAHPRESRSPPFYESPEFTMNSGLFLCVCFFTESSCRTFLPSFSSSLLHFFSSSLLLSTFLLIITLIFSGVCISCALEVICSLVSIAKDNPLFIWSIPCIFVFL